VGSAVDARTHWESVWRSREPRELSWYQAEPRLSLELVRHAAPDTVASIIDVGGGASRLVDSLVAAGYRDLTVLELSAAALRHTRERMGPAAAAVRWIEVDVLSAELPPAAFDLWHDRAVFHFLTAAADRARYVAQLRRALKPGGHAIVATFAPDGPERCSGLPVVRYSPESLRDTLGPGFRLIDSFREEHRTPGGKSQAFVYCLWQLD
jgi:SAM-dependent methyltransferase